MTRRTRYFVMGSVGFLVVGLTVGLAAYFGGVPGFAEPAGPTELNYIPSDATVVAYANVKDLMGSEFRQHIKGLEPAAQEEGKTELKDAGGIDVERDIDYVVACVLASPTATDKRGYVLAHGTFDKPRIEAFIRGKGGVERQYKGRTMFVHPVTEAQAADAPAQEMAVTFIEPNLVGLGSADGLQKVIDMVTGSGSNVRSNGELMEMIEGVSSGNAWVVGRFDVLSQQAHLPNEVAGQLPQLTWFSASGHVNGGLSGTVSAQARDEEAAKNLRQVVAGVIALGKMQAGSKPELNALLQSVQMGNDTGKTVTVSFTVPVAAIDALKSIGGMMHPPQPK